MLFRKKPDRPDDSAGEAPIVKLANAILQQSIVDKASAIRFTPQDKAFIVDYLVGESWREAMTVPKSLRDPLTRRLKIMAQMDVLHERIEQTGKISIHFRDTEHYFLARTSPGDLGETVHLKYDA